MNLHPSLRETSLALSAAVAAVVVVVEGGESNYLKLKFFLWTVNMQQNPCNRH